MALSEPKQSEASVSENPVAENQASPSENPHRPRRPEELDWSKALLFRRKDRSSPSTFIRAIVVGERVQGQASIAPPGTIWAVWEHEVGYRNARPIAAHVFDLEWEVWGADQPAEVAKADPNAEDLLEQWTPKLTADEELEIRELFTYHAPTAEQQERLVKVRAAARHFAAVILSCASVGADRSAAMRKLREAVMTVNAAIVLEGTVAGPRGHR